MTGVQKKISARTRTRRKRKKTVTRRGDNYFYPKRTSGPEKEVEKVRTERRGSDGSRSILTPMGA